MPAVNSKRNKIMNRSRILRAIWLQPIISRVDISRQLGLDKSTVTNLVKELLEGGVLVEGATGDASPQGGRKPVMLRIDGRYGNVLGVELQPDYYRAVLCDLDGGVLGSFSEEFERRGQDFDKFIFEILHRIDRSLELSSRPLLGIGVAMGGIVNSAAGIIHRSIPMELTETYNFNAMVNAHLDVPAFAENDANACALGELTFHRSSAIHDFLFVLVQIRHRNSGRHLYGDIGVGLGIVVNGTLYPGSRSTAGEFRSAFWDGEDHGQFTLTSSESALVASNKDIRTRFFREVSRNVAVVANVMGFSHVFFGGDVMPFAEEFRVILTEELQLRCPYDTANRILVQPSSFGENAVAYGAAGMLLDRLFSDQIFPVGHTRDKPGHTDMFRQLNEAMDQYGGRSQSGRSDDTQRTRPGKGKQTEEVAQCYTDEVERIRHPCMGGS